MFILIELSKVSFSKMDYGKRINKQDVSMSLNLFLKITIFYRTSSRYRRCGTYVHRGHIRKSTSETLNYLNTRANYIDDAKTWNGALLTFLFSNNFFLAKSSIVIFTWKIATRELKRTKQNNLVSVYNLNIQNFDQLCLTF